MLRIVGIAIFFSLVHVESAPAEAQVSKLFKEIGKKAKKTPRTTTSRAYSRYGNARVMYRRVVTANRLNVRECPRVECTRVRSLNKGDEVNVYDVRGDWVRIGPYNEQWVMKKFLSKKEREMVERAELACAIGEIYEDEMDCPEFSLSGN